MNLVVKETNESSWLPLNQLGEDQEYGTPGFVKMGVFSLYT